MAESGCDHTKWIAGEVKALRDLMDERFVGSDRVWAQRLDGIRLYVDTKFAEGHRALDKAEHSMTLRLESMNDLRGQITRYETTLVPRQEYTTRQEQLEYRIAELKDTVAKWRGQFTIMAAVGAGIWALLLLFVGWWMQGRG